MASTQATEKLGIRLGGVTIRRVTAFNAKFIIDNKIGPGSIIDIIRSGDVIPHIVKVRTSSLSGKPSMPNAEYTVKGVDAVLTGSSDLGDQKRIVHFFETLGVEGLKLGVVTKLHGYGLDTIVKIVKAQPIDLMQVDGIQDKLASKLYNNIKASLVNANLPQLMDASGLFGTGMGTRMCQAAVKKYPNMLDLGKERIADNVSRFMDIEGFSDARAKLLAEGLPNFIKFNRELGVKVSAPAEVKQVGKSLISHTVVFTGIRDKTLESIIEANGGTIGSGVSSKTTDLICKSPSDGSAKLEKARGLGIYIATIADFRKKYKL